jgi:hypothetical protein
MDAIYALYPELAGRINFLFVFVELEPPYSVVPLPVDGSFAASGFARWGRAKEIWKQCLESNVWPEYDYAERRIGIPAWKERKIFEEEIA